MTRSTKAAATLITIALLLAASSGCGRDPASTTQPSSSSSLPSKPFVPEDPQLIAANNRGVGLMGKFKYEEARVIFEELAKAHPGWLDVQANLAIATLNRQHEGDEAAALKILDRVLQADPGHLRAHYCSGLLRLYLESPEDALKHFQKVASADPRDAHAAYYVGQCLAQSRQYEQAAEWYRKALDLDPYLRSAYWAMTQALRARRMDADAQQMMEQFQKLEKNPRARMVEFKYTRMGPKGDALAVNLVPPPDPKPLPQGPLFLDPGPLLEDGDKYEWKTRAGALAERPVSITACDIDMDGDIDVFIADALDEVDLHNAVCMNDGTGKFTLDADHILAKVPDLNAALWGDYDNDGLTDVYLCRRGPNMLWRQTNDAKPIDPLLAPYGRPVRSLWQDVSAATRTSNGELDTVDGAMVDFDHDGDLDIFCVNADGPNELLNNNLDGTFRPIAQECGITGAGAGSIQVLPVDLDSDRDLDIVVINRKPPHDVWESDRLWKYRAIQPAFVQEDWRGLIAGDFDSDGFVEMSGLTSTGVSHWSRSGQGQWQKFGFGGTGPAPPSGSWFALTNVSGMSQQNLTLFDRFEWTVTDHSGLSPVYRWTDRSSAILGGCVVNTGPSAASEVVALRSGEPPRRWRAGPGRHNSAGVSFTGRTDPGTGPPPMRSNASGIGVHFSARIDSLWVSGHTLRNSSGPGQSLQPIAIGLGGHPQIDFVSIDWPDGVFQSEIDLTSGQLHTIIEQQRQLSSCPVLFAWNGKKYEFVTDLLGVGGIGYLVSPGSYAPSRPWERLLLPASLLKPKDGRYVLKLGEPMEEACYLDAARLVAYDLPPGWSMTVDDRMNILGPEPTGEPVFYRELILPAHALSGRGQDVTAEVLTADLHAAPVGELDPRFIGRLANDNVITLRFDLPKIDARNPVLIIDGWVEYPYSQTMFAASQAGSGGEYRAPTVEAKDASGQWQVVLEQFGYPAGMPRQMSVPLPADRLPLDGKTLELRISTNQEIYFDRIAVAFAEPCPDAVRHELGLVEAKLTNPGFPHRTTGDQRQPHYDYDRRTPFWDTRHQKGFYTEFGPVQELISQTDGALAIFGPGEEVHLEFGAQALLAGPPAGWSRAFVFEADGWCKDMDLFTREGETVDPLPDQEQHDPVVRRALHDRYNTRYESGR